MSNPEEKLSELINAINTLSGLITKIEESHNNLESKINALELKLDALKLDTILQKIDDYETNSRISPELQDSFKYVAEIPTIRNMISELKSAQDRLDDVSTINRKMNSVIERLDELSSKEKQTIKEDKAKPLSSSEILDPKFEVKTTSDPKSTPAPTPQPVEPPKSTPAPTPQPVEPPKSTPAPTPQPVESPVSTSQQTETGYTSPGIDKPTSGDTEADLIQHKLERKFRKINQELTPKDSFTKENVVKLMIDLRDELESTVGMSPLLFEVRSWVEKVQKVPDSREVLPAEFHTEFSEKMEDWLERSIKVIQSKYAR